MASADVMLPVGSRHNHSSPEDPSDIDTWSTFNFEWLFDPDRIDHLPIDEQLKRYAHRDLKKTKIYKFATKIWGAPLSRKRFIVAPPMHPASRRVLNGNVNTDNSTSELKPQIPIDKGPSKEFIQEQIEKDKVNKYKSWIEQRKTFRKDLDNMGLNIEYLDKKPDKTALEKRVLRRLLNEKYPKRPETPPREDSPLIAIMRDDVPLVQRPSPMAIKIIEKFLHENKLRLIDLFRSVDKDKDWKVTRDEFRNALVKAKIPISEVLLEDLILALDTDLNNELDYRELAKGMGLWKIEKRESKRKRMGSATFSASPSKFSQMSGFESPEQEQVQNAKSRSSVASGTLPSSPTKEMERSAHTTSQGGARTSSQGGARTTSTSQGKDRNTSTTGIPVSVNDTQERTGSGHRIKSALSTISSSSSTHHLVPPDPDTRPETRVVDSQEAMLDLRKRDREALANLTNKKGPGTPQKPIKKRETSKLEAKEILRTGDPLIDNHLTPSTMGGETAEQVNRFRQLRYKEYNQICNLCEERNVPLSEGLLKKVLMLPPDRPHKELKKKIRQPSMPLHSQHFADPPKEPVDEIKSPTQEEQMAQKAKKVKVAKDGKIEVFVDSRQAYPKRTKVAAIPQKVTLSSGKAVIRRQVDCWLTFEEYERLTRHLTTRYVNLHGHTDDNAFWPGHLLDKLHLCMPEQVPRREAVLYSTKQPKRSNPGYNNNLRTWPISDKGFVQFGGIA